VLPGVLQKAGGAVREWLRDRFCRPCAFGRGALEACCGCRVLEAEEKAEELAGIVLDAAGAAEIGEAPAAAAWPEAGRQDEVPAYVVAVRRAVRAALEGAKGGGDCGR